LDSNILLFNNNEYSSQSELLYSYSNLKNDEVKEITGTGEVDTKRFKLSIEGEEEEEDKFSKRKKQVRTASKLYRQRKKELEKQLTSRLISLEQEKKMLLREQIVSERLLQNLKEENDRLKRQQAGNATEIAKVRYELLRKLEKEFNEMADESVLLDTLAEIGEQCIKCQEIASCHLKHLISPLIVEKLVSKNFFDKKENMEALIRTNGLKQMNEKAKVRIENISPEQIQKMDDIVENHLQRMQIIHSERMVLAQQINTLFKELKQKKSDFSEFLQSIRCLEHLRMNFDEEAKEWHAAQKDVISILNTRQIAQFYLRVAFQHATVCQLNVIWSAINESWANNKHSYVYKRGCCSNGNSDGQLGSESTEVKLLLKEENSFECSGMLEMLPPCSSECMSLTPLES